MFSSYDVIVYKINLSYHTYVHKIRDFYRLFAIFCRPNIKQLLIQDVFCWERQTTLMIDIQKKTGLIELGEPQIQLHDWASER